MSKRPSSRFAQTRDFLAEMQRRIERRDLLLEAVDQFLRAAHGQRGDVVDRLVGIQLGALSAGRAQRIDEVAGDSQQSELEHLEQPAGPAPMITTSVTIGDFGKARTKANP